MRTQMRTLGDNVIHALFAARCSQRASAGHLSVCVSREDKDMGTRRAIYSDCYVFGHVTTRLDVLLGAVAYAFGNFGG
jgi:hypothetical protein